MSRDALAFETRRGVVHARLNDAAKSATDPLTPKKIAQGHRDPLDSHAPQHQRRQYQGDIVMD